MLGSLVRVTIRFRAVVILSCREAEVGVQLLGGVLEDGASGIDFDARVQEASGRETHEWMVRECERESRSSAGAALWVMANPQLCTDGRSGR